MSQQKAGVPILVGAGQKSLKEEASKGLPDPVAAIRDVIHAAADDAQCKALVEKADSLHIVNMTSWGFKDPPSIFAQGAGMNPKLKEYSAMGGQSPQQLVNRAADNLAAGRSSIAVIAGCEAWYTAQRAGKFARWVGDQREKPEVPLIGVERRGVSQQEIEHSVVSPLHFYPLFENALRAKEGLTLKQQQTNLGQFAESFSAVAAKNPYSWNPTALTAKEAVTATKKNRMICFPYTKFLNSCPTDMAAAVIMTTTVEARRLGIPEHRWVYIHGGQEAHDEWLVGDRPDMADSPAIRAMVKDTLDQAGLTLDQMSFFDLYSCFPVMPRMACKAIGIEDNDPRPLTITGGLPYFGGPGNNYVMHSIAEAMALCRVHPDEFGMITANGMFATKHGVGIYSHRAPSRPWKRTSPEQFQKDMAMPPPMIVDPEPSGEFTVDSYTVAYGREGDKISGILCGRTSEGKRAWGHTPAGGQELLDDMTTSEWVGKKGKITKQQGKVNIVDFG